MADNDRTIVVQYQGWCRVEDADIRFCYTGENPDKLPIITGEQYRKLPEEDRDEYSLDSLTHSINASCDGDVIDLDISITD